MKLFISHRPNPAPTPSPAPPAASKPVPAAKIEETAEKLAKEAEQKGAVEEIGGPTGPEPTRYGDWERNGICSDF